MEDTMTTGNAPESGEMANTEGEQQHTEGSSDTRRDDPRTVPYGRFQEVNAKRKAAEDTLAAIVDEMCNDVPEDMRGLIPNLPPAEKVKWLREARTRGLFRASAPTSSPDSKRPVAKTSEDLSNLSPVAMMARGYK